ncbi:hypothetical protein NE237_017338 [Protea cynaroides]|uniref:Reverse transcriptase zinc-binding domain-containing protein n=1 Tax=Protea cynaroides TaxID=273540 RepID=A0A9Q0QN31_9MAGN|nr:hypothetical protein NE237_017338 [Protea cynaroides]
MWGIPKLGKVSSVIVGDEWQNCPIIPNLQWKFGVKWIGFIEALLLKMTKCFGTRINLSFSSKSVWNAIRNQHPKIGWEKAIWFTGCLPRHAFVARRSVLDCLPTSDQIRKRNVVVPIECCLCHLAPESINHLSFTCGFSLTIWKGCMSLSNQHCNVSPFSDPVTTATWVASNLKTFGKALFCSSIYHIWRERNKRKFAHQERSVKTLAQVIANEAQDMMWVNLKFSSSDHSFGQNKANRVFKVN